jgi:uncharacterized phage protein (TIGR02220 family)
VFHKGIARIAKRGCVTMTPTAIVVPNFMPAQEARKSDAVRQRESRARRRELASGTMTSHQIGDDGATTEDDSVDVTPCHTMSHDVTPSHAPSRNVTPSLAVLSLAQPSLAQPNQETGRVGASADVPTPGGAEQPDERRQGDRRQRKRRNGLTGTTADEVAAVTAVLERLSDRTGRRYSPEVEGHAAPVLAALRRGFSEDDLRTVVWERANKWGGDPKMDEFLRPSTLFGKEKLPEYLAHARAEWEASDRPTTQPKRLEPPPSRLLLGLIGGGKERS